MNFVAFRTKYINTFCAKDYLLLTKPPSTVLVIFVNFSTESTKKSRRAGLGLILLYVSLFLYGETPDYTFEMYAGKFKSVKLFIQILRNIYD